MAGKRQTADLGGGRSAVDVDGCAPPCATNHPCTNEACDQASSDGKAILANQPVDDSTLSMRSLGGQQDGLYVEGSINGKLCKMLIDTGASVSIVSTSMINEHNKVLSKSPFTQLRTATGQVTPVHGCSTLDITIGRYSGQHVMLVADVMDCCIIGLDFLQQYRCTLDIAGRVLQMDGMQIKLLPRTAPIGPICQRIVTMEPLEIKAGEDAMIPAGLIPGGHHSGFGVIESNHRKNMADGLLLGRTLVDLEDEVLPVRVANVTDKTLKIAPGTWIADCHTVDYVERNVPVQPQRKHAPLPAYLNDVYARSTEDLDGEQQQIVFDLLLEFEDVFASSPSEMGRTSLTRHRIDTGDTPPIRQPARRMPLVKQAEADAAVHDMLQRGIIEPSDSPWSSPVVLVRKRNGELRFCVDYRLLNGHTRKDSYPLPRIDATLEALSGSTCFSTLDLQSGYWQIDMHPDDKDKTAFTTGKGLWNFRTMPFGLCNAPATFERLMDLVLKGLPWTTCLVYLDDILIHGKSFMDNAQSLRAVFLRLRHAGLKLNPSKCELFRPKVTYLGHVISRDGIATDPAKTAVIRDWPTPRNVKDVRQFTGLCSYYRRYAPGFAHLAKPLHQLTEKGRRFVWTAECDDAFRQLKQLLTSAPLLACPSGEGTFILDTDASDRGIGCVFSQEQGGEEHVIAYYSRTLSRPERNYCVTRKELLAVVASIAQFHHYLYGRRFIVRSDHASLQWLMHFKQPEGQTARWLQKLQEYDFEVVHRPGRQHGNADALSRLPRPCLAMDCSHCRRQEEREGVADDIPCVCETTPLREDETVAIAELPAMRDQQMADENLACVIRWLESDRRPDRAEVAAHSEETKIYWAQWNSLRMRDGQLYRRWESTVGKLVKWQLVLPKTARDDVLRQLHDGPTGGHYGENKTLEKIRHRYYWAKCGLDVKLWCKLCAVCAAKKGAKKTRSPLQQYEVGCPMERIAMDFMGPFPETESGNRHLLVIMDYFTKWPEAYALPNQEALTVAKVLAVEFVPRHGVPLELHTDQGRNFESTVIRELCQLLGIHKTRTTAFHPRSDGMVERYNLTIGRQLAMFIGQHQSTWDQQLPMLLLSYRSAVHETTGFTPSMLMYGRELTLPVDLMYGRPEEECTGQSQYVLDLQHRLDAVHRFARDTASLHHIRTKRRYDLRANGSLFEPGDLVWMANPQRKKGICPKLTNPWEGPYTVRSRRNDVLYSLQKGPRSQPKLVHRDRLRAYRGVKIDERWTTIRERNVPTRVDDNLPRASKRRRTRPDRYTA